MDVLLEIKLIWKKDNKSQVTSENGSQGKEGIYENIYSVNTYTCIFAFYQYSLLINFDVISFRQENNLSL